MYENLILFLKECINDRLEEIKSISVKINDIRPVYDILIPNKNKRDVIKAERIKDRDSFYKFIELIAKYNIILYNKIIALDNEIKESERKKLSSLQNTNLPIIISKTQMRQYNVQELQKIQLEENRIRKSIEQLLSYSFTFIVNLYESLESNKEKQKEIMKNCGYVLKNINSKLVLNARDISVITNMINESSKQEEEKELLFNELNDYIIKTKKEKNIAIPDTKELLNDLPIVYKDDSVNNSYEIKEEINYYNYLITIKSFDNNDDIKTFLESIKFSCNINKIVQNVINMLGNSKRDIELKVYLQNYLSNFVSDEEKNESIESNNIILYHGFLENKNRILSDITKSGIPKEYYGDVLAAINMIKQGDTKGKTARIDSIRKVLKLRYKDIRITYKKLSNNIYVVLGVFCKKDNKGYEVINKTRKRDKTLSTQEKNIINAISISDLWNEYIKENIFMEDEIIHHLSSWVK